MAKGKTNRATKRVKVKDGGEASRARPSRPSTSTPRPAKAAPRSKEAVLAKLSTARGGAKPVRLATARPPVEANAPLRDIAAKRQELRDEIARYRSHQFAAYVEATPQPTLAAREIFSVRGGRTEGTGAFKPSQLRILAEGDSWFEYPLRGLIYRNAADGVIYRLQEHFGYRIANMAHHGDEVRQMLGLRQRQEIISRLSQRDVRFNALLFSGGGNDMVGDPFLLWLKESPAGTPPEQLLDDAATDAVMGTIEAGFRDLISVRDRYSPDTVIFVHGYDFPPITGQDVCGQGPWLKPSLDYFYRSIGVSNPDPHEEFKVVRRFLERFNEMLLRVQNDGHKNDFIVVPTQGTLKANNDNWQNEIHPSQDGFKQIAAKFDAAIRQRFS